MILIVEGEYMSAQYQYQYQEKEEYTGFSSRPPRRKGNIAFVNIIIVAINICVFFFLEWLGDTESAQFMAEHGAIYPPFVILEGEYYRLFTAMFLHFGIRHLFNNMLVLFFLGDNLERAVGHVKYLVIYLLSGICAGVFSIYMMTKTGDMAVSAGASGAIFGMIGALLYIVIINKGRLEDITFQRLGLMIILSLYMGFTSTGVDNMAHIGGLISGAILALLLYRKHKG